MAFSKNRDSGDNSKWQRGGGREAHWDDGIEYVEIEDSKGKRKPVWKRLRLIDDPFKFARHWLTSFKANKPFPIFCPNFDHHTGKKVAAAQACCPIDQLGPFTERDGQVLADRSQVKAYPTVSLLWNVIDRDVEDGRRVKALQALPESVLSTLDREIDDAGVRSVSDLGHPARGYDIRLCKDTGQQGAAVWAVKVLKPSPLTEEEIALVYGLFKVTISAKTMKAFLADAPGNRKVVDRLGFKENKKGNFVAKKITGLDVEALCQGRIDMSFEKSDESTSLSGLVRVTKFHILDHEIEVEEVQAAEAYDFELLYNPTSPEEILRTLKMNRYIDDESSDDDEDERPAKSKRKSDDDEDEQPKRGKSKRKSDDDEDERPAKRVVRRQDDDDDDDEEDDPKPPKRKLKQDDPLDDDEDEPKPKKKTKPAPWEDDEDEPKPKKVKRRVVDEDDEDDKPDDDDEEEDAPKPKKKAGKDKAAEVRGSLVDRLKNLKNRNK